MTSSMLFTSGTRDGAWTAWFPQWLSQSDGGRRLAQPESEWPTTSADAKEAGGGLDLHASADLAQLAQRFPDARFVLFVERPYIGLARFVASNEQGSPEHWLEEWRDGARRILRHVQRHPDRCLVIDAEEAARHSGALMQKLQALTAIELPEAAAAPQRPKADALAVAIADYLSLADRDARSLMLELRACCDRLDDSADSAALESAVALPDGEELRRRLLALIESERAQPGLREDLANSRSELASHAASLQNLAERVSQAMAERDTLAKRLNAETHQLTTAHAASLQTLGEQLSQAVAERDELATRLNDETHQLTTAHAASLQTLSEQLSQAVAERDELATRLNAETHQLIATHAASLQTLSERVSQAVAERDALATRLKAVTRQLGQAREAAEVQRETAQATLARDDAVIEQMKVEAGRLTESNAAVTAAHESLRQQMEALEARHDESAQEVQRARLELHRVRQQYETAVNDNELLKLQLGQIHEELELLVRRGRELETALTNSPASDEGMQLHVARIELQTERPAAPHRELTFLLEDVRTQDSHTDELLVRLVEHHGHPGLVIFAASNGSKLLNLWDESGREGERSFVLIVPNDTRTKSMLEAMRSTDWLTVTSLVARLERELQQTTVRQSLRWVNVARRLREQLKELDRRFRCDAATCTVNRIEASSIVEATFEHVHFGVRYLPRLSLRWRPDGPAAAISLANDPDTGPPLSSWPLDEIGTALPAAVLPLGSEVAQRDLPRVLKSLSPGDREFLQALLAAMPALVSSAAPALQAAAQGLQARAQRALAPAGAAQPRARLINRLASKLNLGPSPRHGTASN